MALLPQRVWDNRSSPVNRVLPMQNQKIFEEINERVRAVLAQSPAADIEKNMRAMLASLFSRLDLVTREEFDVQREVLARTRQKLEDLEARVAELEKQFQNRGSSVNS
jgi:BMFP domain-containing protein YqiC